MDQRPIGAMRVGYTNPPLIESDMSASPLAQFDAWFDEAVAAGITEPNAMVLATADDVGRVSSRTVLLKGIEPAGLVFFTNLQSAKSQAIAANPNVSVVFPWYALQRQVCITGAAALIPRSDVDDYFASRPRESQLGAWASDQSQVIASAHLLRENFDEVAEKFPDKVPTPPHWGGLRIEVDTMEFWSGQPSRLHDRLRYRRVAAGHLDDPAAWVLERLAP